jgi:hypothetical protein
MYVCTALNSMIEPAREERDEMGMYIHRHDSFFYLFERRGLRKGV